MGFRVLGLGFRGLGFRGFWAEGFGTVKEDPMVGARNWGAIFTAEAGRSWGELSMEAAQISLPAGIHHENDCCLFFFFWGGGGGGGWGLRLQVYC